MDQPHDPRREYPEPRQASEPLFNLRPGDAPGAVLCVVMIAIFAAGAFTGGPVRWATSAAALADGRPETLITHMFVHAGLMHLLMNLSALFALSRVVVHRLGTGRAGWLLYLALFLMSGLAGAGLYLAIHPAGATPMLGASGAVCGLWGAVARLSPDGGIAPLRSRQVAGVVREFAIVNAILFALLFALTRMAGGAGGLAWEAHLGGFVFGILAIPLLVRGHIR